jgi:hypothetical protein
MRTRPSLRTARPSSDTTRGATGMDPLTVDGRLYGQIAGARRVPRLAGNAARLSAMAQTIVPRHELCPLAEPTAHDARFQTRGREGSRAIPPLFRLLEDRTLFRSAGGRHSDGIVLSIGACVLRFTRSRKQRGGRIEFVYDHTTARGREAEKQADPEKSVHAFLIGEFVNLLELRSPCRSRWGDEGRLAPRRSTRASAGAGRSRFLQLRSIRP